MASFHPFLASSSTLLLFLTFLHCPSSISFCKGEIPTLQYQRKLSFVSGTFAQYLPDPLFYDAWVPLLYEFRVPKHMENALKIMWTHATVCNKTDSRYDGKLCPVVFHLHKIIANLSSDMGFWKDFLPESQLPSDDDDGHGHGHDRDATARVKVQGHDHDQDQGDGDGDETLAPNFCREIAPHFSSLYTTKEQLQRYKHALGKCPLGENAQEITRPSTWIIDKQIYYTMVDRFYTEFYRTLPATGNVDWVTTLNSYTTLSGILLSNNYMESNRVMNAMLECGRGRGVIPHSFIRPSTLLQGLLGIQGKVRSSHYQFLWGNSNSVKDLTLEAVAPYFKLPLADCTFTDDFRLLIRLQIPVRRTELSSKLLEIRSFPFVEKFNSSLKLCRLGSPSGSGGSLRVVESSSGLLLQPDITCASKALCPRSSLDSFPPGDSCMSAILTNNNSMIREQCPLNCFPVGGKSLPLFLRKSPDTFIVVGSSDTKIFIQCNGQPLEQILLSNVGSLEVKLSCGCQISYRSLVFGALEGLCTKDGPSVRHILPLHWDPRGTNSSKEDDVSIPLDLDLELDENMILESLEKADMAKEKDKEYYKYHVDGENGGDSHGGKSQNQPQVSVEAVDASTGNGFLVQICLLWVLLVGLIALNVLLLYHVHHLLKWKKIQAYKDTRIVYSVPASPQFPNKF